MCNRLIAIIALLIVSAPAAAQSTRPALSQLDAELRALYGEVAAGTVRVRLPASTLARLTGEAGHPMHKWAELVDAEVWSKLQEMAATRPAKDPEAARAGRKQPAQGESRTVEFLDEMVGSRMVAVLPRDGMHDLVGIVLDGGVHVAIPAYVTREEAGDRPLHVTAGHEQVDATFVGSDRQTNVTVLKLGKPFGKPLGFAEAKPDLGSLMLMLAPSRRGATLKVWSGGHEDHAVLVDVAGRIAGFARPGQLLAGGDLNFVAGEIIRHGKVKRAQLGVLIGQVQSNDPIRHQVPLLGARPALRVMKVLPNSAAAAGGLQVGDLFVSLAGEAVEDLPTFAAAISSHSGPTELKLIRDGKETTITVNLEPK